MSGLVRTDETLEALERALIENHGHVGDACKACGLGGLIGQVHLWAENDPEVKERIRLAQMIGWSTLEGEAIRRAVHGVEEDVYFKGEVVGTKTVYSDGLLAQMLKARVPGYKEDASVKGPTVQVNIVPRAESYEEWIAMRERTLKITHSPQVPNVIEGEFTPVDNGLGDLGI